jgi:hypothetical protein
MTTRARVLAGTMAAVGVGGAAVALPAEPASAHDTHLRLGDSTAAVGESHRSIRVCNRDPGYRAQVRYYDVVGVYHEFGDRFADDACVSLIGGTEHQVSKWRLCLEPGGGCTGWKDA